MKSCGVYIIDELDYTPAKYVGDFGWCVSVGYVKNMKHVAGAIYSPDVFCGAVYYASKGSGCYLVKNVKICGTEKTKLKIPNVNDFKKEGKVFFGVRFINGEKYPVYNKLLDGRLYRKFWMPEESPSCALGLARAAAGAVHGYVQPPQSPWDWAAGKVLIEEAGGKFIPIEGRKEIKLIDKLEPEHYVPDRVGFIAGKENVCNELVKMLLEVKL